MGDDSGKIWYKSKTLWVNAISLAASFLQSKYGYAMDGATQGMILTGLNILLRLITHEEIVWSWKYQPVALSVTWLYGQG